MAKLVIELDDWQRGKESAGAAKVRMMRACHVTLTRHLQAMMRRPVELVPEPAPQPAPQPSRQPQPQPRPR